MPGLFRRPPQPQWRRPTVFPPEPQNYFVTATDTLSLTEDVTRSYGASPAAYDTPRATQQVAADEFDRTVATGLGGSWTKLSGDLDASVDGNVAAFPTLGDSLTYESETLFGEEYELEFWSDTAATCQLLIRYSASGTFLGNVEFFQLAAVGRSILINKQGQPARHFFQPSTVDMTVRQRGRIRWTKTGLFAKWWTPSVESEPVDWMAGFDYGVAWASPNRVQIQTEDLEGETHFLEYLRVRNPLEDAVASTLAAARTASDTTSISESINRSGTFNRTSDDSLSFTESTAGSVGFERAAADSQTFTDSIARITTANRAITDAPGPVGELLVADEFQRVEPDAEANLGGPWTFGPHSDPNATAEIDGEILIVDNSIDDFSEMELELATPAMPFEIRGRVRRSGTESPTGTWFEFYTRLRDSVGGDDQVSIDIYADDTPYWYLSGSELGEAANFIENEDTLYDFLLPLDTWLEAWCRVYPTHMVAGIGDRALHIRNFLTTTTADLDRLQFAIYGGNTTIEVDWIRIRALGDEEVAGLLAAGRAATDSLTLSESVEGSFTYERTATDSQTLSETVAGLLAANATATDTLSLSESVGRLLALNVTASDTLSLSENVAALLVALRSLEDTLTLTESVDADVGVGSTHHDRTASDSLSLSESIAALTAQLRSLTDTLSLSESIAASSTQARTASDTVSLTESVAGSSVQSRTASDSTTVSESAAALASLSRTAADALSLSESISALLAAIRTLTDSFTISESVTGEQQGDLQRVATDTLDLDESIATSSIQSRTLEDTTTVSESIAALLAAVRAISESVPTSEQIAASSTQERALTDTFSLNESVAGAGGGAVSADDTLSFSDTVEGIPAYHRFVDEALTTSESITTTAIFERTLVDTIILTETATTDWRAPDQGEAISTLSAEIVAAALSVEVVGSTITVEIIASAIDVEGLG